MHCIGELNPFPDLDALRTAAADAAHRPGAPSLHDIMVRACIAAHGQEAWDACMIEATA